MPRPAKTVKLKSKILGHSHGAVDLHFHGAFGIDLMTASEKELNDLSLLLWKQGVSAFCPTTLSSTPEDLKKTVTRLGTWIQNRKKSRGAKDAQGAVPLGIHLEGPFISSHACGAHLPSVIRKLDFRELQSLWVASKNTLKILTIAPETLTSPELKSLKKWAKDKKIRLSLGHSRCTEKQALQAFQNGFSGVTHGWNALAYHHRDPGAMGAAFSLAATSDRLAPTVELIIDQVHVSPRWLQMTLALLPKNIIFVSDCAPAAGLTTSRWCKFGNLRCRLEKGAARLENGTLAGGGLILTEAFAKWIQTQSQLSPKNTPRDTQNLWKKQIASLTSIPLKALEFTDRQIPKNRLEWRQDARHQVSFAWKKLSD